MTEQLKAVLLDDQISSSEFLQELLKDYHPEVTIVGICERADQALLCIAEHMPDILFLDIEMPDKNGFDFFRLLDKIDIPVQCIIVSAHFPKYYQEALDAELTLYLEKPVAPKELEIVLNKAKEKIRRRVKNAGKQALDANRKIPLNTAKGILYVYPEEVLFAKADKKCTDLWIKNKGQVKIMKGISDILKTLNNKNILRTDKSWFINLVYLKEIHEQTDKVIIQAEGDKPYDITITNDGFTFLKQTLKKLRPET